MKINLNNASLKISAGLVKQFPANPVPQICFSGRSNVGKSSLMNILLNRKALARVSSTPGKTITINFYDIDSKLYLVDLPGYGYAKRTPAERAALSRITDAFFTNNKQINRLKLVLQLIDSRVGINADDATMLDYLNSMQIPYCVVMTKTDKLNKTELEASYNDIASSPFLAEAAEIFGKDIEIVRFSALNGTGVERIKSLVIGACS